MFSLPRAADVSPRTNISRGTSREKKYVRFPSSICRLGGSLVGEPARGVSRKFYDSRAGRGHHWPFSASRRVEFPMGDSCQGKYTATHGAKPRGVGHSDDSCSPAGSRGTRAYSCTSGRALALIPFQFPEKLPTTAYTSVYTYVRVHRDAVETKNRTRKVPISSVTVDGQFLLDPITRKPDRGRAGGDEENSRRNSPVDRFTPGRSSQVVLAVSSNLDRRTNTMSDERNN